MKYIGITTIVLLITACVTVIPPSKGIGAGNMAYERGEYEQARINYSSALDLAEQQNWKPHIATAKYGLGRSYGQLCQFELAEKYLKQAVMLEEEISQGKGVHLFQDYFELARLYYDYGEYHKSIPYFQKAVPAVEEHGITTSDPIGYANVLEDYADALSKSGDSHTANAIKEKIVMLRNDNVGRSAGFKIIRFNPECASNKVPKQTQ